MDRIFVIPELAKSECNAFGNVASAGIHVKEIPAFAGMTSKGINDARR